VLEGTAAGPAARRIDASVVLDFERRLESLDTNNVTEGLTTWRCVRNAHC
jgi:hypothetical protein